MTRILVIQTAFIGDAILATALLETLHGGLPDAHIDLLVRKGNESLFRDHPFLKTVWTWDKKNGKYKSLLQLLKQIRANRYDYVVNLQRYGATGFLTSFSGAKQTIGFEKNPFSFLFTRRYAHQFEKGIHEIDRNHQLAATITNATIENPRLYPSERDFERVAAYQATPYFCIAPTSVWFTKQFPLSQWARLIRELPPEHPVYLIGAPGDADAADSLIRLAAREQVVNLCGKLSFLESAALFKGALLNYVNDSAPMHLCSAVNAPVCVIYCSTVPDFGYGPLSTEASIVQIDEKLACRPCGIHGHKSCPQGHFDCAMKIDIARLAEKALKV